MADLSRKRERERLKVRRDPYTMRLAEGAYLAFRRGPDTWLARFRDRDGKQHYGALNVASDDYDGAKRAAEAFFVQMGGSAVRSPKRSTVTDALQTYLTDLERHGRTDAARTARSLFKTVLKKDDPLAALPLESASRDDFEEWRDRLRPGRKARSVNRYCNQFIAALHRAHELGHVGNPAAWSLKPLTDDTDDEEGTAIFLDPAQRAALVAAASPSAALFFRGLELTGARPSELAGATVADFDGKTVRLSHRKGKGSKFRQRYTVLDKAGVEFFTQCAAGKLPMAPLFTEDGQQPWRRHMWAYEMREAAKAVNKEARGKARIPEGVGAYAFRHARISELLQVHGVDPLTVGHQTGTSLAMIEKAYMRFIPQALADKLAGIKATA
jgi:integrase